MATITSELTLRPIVIGAGPVGPAGPAGPTGDPGAGVSWQGEWSATTYAANDAVEHNGSSWIANAATTAVQEPGVHANWDLWVAKGDTGPEGDTGLLVADLAALRASTSTAYATATVTSKDGGVFYKDDADTTSADNGGTTIVRGDGKRFKRLVQGLYNVKWFGAVGDGVADDTAAIAAAMATGHSIFFPNGTYRTSEPMNFYTSGQRIIGESENSVKILVTANVSAAIIKQTNNTLWPPATGTSAGGQQNGSLENMRFVYDGGVANTSEGFTVEPNVLNSNYTIESFEVRNCHMEGWDIGWEVQYASKMKFFNVNAKDSISKGFYVHGATNNCPEFHQVHVNGGSAGTPIGVHIDGMNGGIVTLGDFALTTVAGVKIENSQVTVSGGELESFDSVTPNNPTGNVGTPGVFFDITNSKVHVEACRFLTGYGAWFRLNSSATVTMFANSGTFTNTGHADYVARVVEHTSTTSVCFGFNGGLWTTGDIGSAGNIINTQRLSDGTLCQITFWPMNGAIRDTPTYTPDGDWLGLMMHEKYVSAQQGGALVSWGRNGAGEYYKYALNQCNLPGNTYSSATKVTEGWEQFITKDGGTLTLRDPVNAYNKASRKIPKVLFVYNRSATTDLTLGRHNFAETQTINGVAADQKLGPKQSCWLLTTGEDSNWIMIRNESMVGNSTQAGSVTLTAKQCYGDVISVTSTGTLTLPTGVYGMGVTVTTRGAIAVSVKAGPSDKLYLDGVALDDADKATNTSTAGDTINLVCDINGDWVAISDGWTDTGA